MPDQAQTVVSRAPSAVLPEISLASGRCIAADYDGRLFVAPTDDNQWLLARIRRWMDGSRGEGGLARARQEADGRSRPAEQVLRLVGERGSGKTWFLKHLAEGDAEATPAAVYLDLEQRHDFRTPQEFVAAVQARSEQRCEGAACILCLDSVPTRMDAHLRALEEIVLRPHLSQSRSMVVMALGHPSRDCWRLPALRGGESHWLRLFGLAQTRAQLGLLDGAGLVRQHTTAAAVQDYGGGLPLLNYLLARWQGVHGYSLLLEYVLSRVPAESLQLVRNCLDAVCVLEVLEHEPVEKALRLYRRLQPRDDGTPAHAVQVRSVLRQHWLARAAPGMPGRIILVDSVRRAAREVLRAKDPETFVLMNEAIYGTAGGG